LSNAPSGRRWDDKLVVIGSSALANDLTDRGATPLLKDTLLVSKHWNVANSLLNGRFVTKSSLGADLLVIALLALASAFLTWRFRALYALSIVLLLAFAFSLASAAAYAKYRVWFPVMLPLLALLLAQLCLLAWRVVFEQAEHRRVKAVFAKMISPKIVSELLAAERLSLGGAKVEVTVFFADLRGFTELTVQAQQRAVEEVRRRGLTGAAAETCFDEHARETLEAVNAYLAVVANVVIRNDGTLDKFIGDCVMAYWGAPKAVPNHARLCVRAAIEAQTAVSALNVQRQEENERRRAENKLRQERGQPVLPMLPVLALGTGINTGVALAGLMGSSEVDSMSYTLFGREVNLASRLEGASGRGRIFISQSTLRHLQACDQELASKAQPVEPVILKGFSEPVPVFEMPWSQVGVSRPSPQPAHSV
jgi:adenylate cyclase